MKKIFQQLIHEGNNLSKKGQPYAEVLMLFPSLEAPDEPYDTPCLIRLEWGHYDARICETVYEGSMWINVPNQNEAFCIRQAIALVDTKLADWRAESQPSPSSTQKTKEI